MAVFDRPWPLPSRGRVRVAREFSRRAAGQHNYSQAAVRADLLRCPIRRVQFTEPTESVPVDMHAEASCGL